MVSYLVVANQTLGGHALSARLQELHDRATCRFHIVVPSSHPSDTWTWTAGTDRAAADIRLKAFTEELRGRGLAVTGEAGDADPVSAVGDVLRRERGGFDEIVLSTLALGVSRWLGQDLPHRMERAFGIPLMVVTSELTRAYDGRHIPEPGTYDIDTAHSRIEFVARFLTISTVRGRFGTFTGSIQVADAPDQSSVAIEIDATSVDTHEWQRDAHLRSADFLDVNNHPTMSFQSTAVAPEQDDRWRVTGDLTLRGVTRPVALDVEFAGVALLGFGEQRIGLRATADIDRETWGLTWNRVLETGGVLVGRRVQVELDVQAVRR